MRSLADEVDRRLARLPVLASTTQHDVTFELHGRGTPTTVCARAPGAPAVCAAPFGQFGNVAFDQPTYVVGSMVRNGEWLLLAADPARATFVLPLGAQSAVTPLPDQVTSPLGPWQLTSTVVRLALDRVQVTSDGSSFLTFDRPG